jgi:hypothetical protein
MRSGNSILRARATNTAGIVEQYDTTARLLRRSIQLRGAVQWFSRAIFMRRTACARELTADIGFALAEEYCDRGLARVDGNDLTGALTDFSSSIEQLENLRHGLGAQWPAAMREALARTYINRGSARRNRGDLAGGRLPATMS